MKEDLPKGWRQLSTQTDLLGQEIEQAINSAFSFYEMGPTDDGTAWYLLGGARTTAVLFRQELLDLTRRHLRWATAVEVQQWFGHEEPYQYVRICVSPLPIID